MLRAYLKLLIRNMAAAIDAAIARIDHNTVIKDLAGGVELSGSYLLITTSSFFAVNNCRFQDELENKGVC